MKQNLKFIQGMWGVCTYNKSVSKCSRVYFRSVETISTFLSKNIGEYKATFVQLASKKFFLGISTLWAAVVLQNMFI